MQALRDAPPHPSRIYFPIADNAQEYEAAKRRKIFGARQETFDAIDAIKPYKGGNDQLWMLHKLNNIEKHRLLITVGSSFQSINLAAHAIGVMQRAIAKDPSHPMYGKEIPKLDLFFRTADAMFPLKAGDKLFTDTADAEFNQNLQFCFGVALSEPQIIEAQSIVDTLHQLTAVVEGIVIALTPRLRDTP